jgi:hypothetical protein
VLGARGGGTLSGMAGTGSEITLQEAIDLLYKLITESAKVQATLRTEEGLRAAVLGTVIIAPVDPEGTIAVIADHSSALTSRILFNPASSVRRVYGDHRAFLPEPEIPGAPHRLSVLCFFFSDKSRICLHELERRG